MLTLIQTAKLNDVEPQVCWPGSPITKSPTWPRSCLGIGATRSLSPAPLDPGARASAVTISRAAELLSKDQQTIAFALPE